MFGLEWIGIVVLWFGSFLEGGRTYVRFRQGRAVIFILVAVYICITIRQVSLL